MLNFFLKQLANKCKVCWPIVLEKNLTFMKNFFLKQLANKCKVCSMGHLQTHFAFCSGQMFNTKFNIHEKCIFQGLEKKVLSSKSICFVLTRFFSLKRVLKSSKKKNKLTDDSPKNISFMINQITKPTKIQNT